MIEYIFLFLIGATTSAISAILGMAGGILLMSSLATILPIRVAIPIHAIAQMTSNLGRVLIHWKHIQWKKVFPFFAAAIPGALVGGVFATRIPESVVLMGAGIYIVTSIAYITLKKKKTDLPKPTAKKVAAVGFASASLGMIAGAVGPVMTPLFLAFRFERHVFIGTMAAAQSFNHFLKIPVYFAWGGFHPTERIALIGVLLAGVFAGIPIGTYFLDKLPERLFRNVVTTVTGVMGVYLFIKGLLQHFATI